MVRHIGIGHALAAAFLGVAALAQAASMALGGAVDGFSPLAGMAAAMAAVGGRARSAWVVAAAAAAVLVSAEVGAPPSQALAVGVAVIVQAVVAAATFRRSTDPIARPETAAWWWSWAAAAGLGAALGALVFAGGSALAGAPDAASDWFVNHLSSLVLVAPGAWTAIRWWRTGGLEHASDRRALVSGIAAVTVATVSAAGLMFWLDRLEPVALPWLTLGWLAARTGHRITVTASSVVGSALLVALPWWQMLHPEVSTTAVVLAVVMGHAAASGLAIEASGRRHARALLAGVVDVAAEAVMVVDGSGRIKIGNPAAREMFGDGLEGQAITDVIPGMAPDWPSDPPRQAELSARSGEGEDRVVEASVAPVDAGGRPMFAVVARDLTEGRATVAALRRSAEIIDAAADLVAWTDSEGRPLHVNLGGRDMLGTGDLQAARDLFPADARAVAAQDGSWRGETTVRRAGTDAEIPASQLINAHRGEGGEIRFYSTIVRDISERRELMEMKQKFVADLTHELRSPLTGIIGYLDLIGQGAFGDPGDELGKVLADVRFSSDRLMELIDDMLSLWRAEDPAARSSEVVEVADIVTAALSALGPVSAGRRFGLAVEAPRAAVFGDRRSLERMLLNVVSNAVKFTPQGGTVDLDVVHLGEMVRVTVADTGVGIPAEELEAVFDRFYRASTAERAGIPGSGLGLPLVREIVRSHGGTIAIRSEVGCGTTVVIDLPVHGDRQLAAAR